MSRWKLSFDALNPTELDSTWSAGIDEGHYRKLQHYGHEKALARLILVREVLEEIFERIYAGWSRPNREDCFVYVGQPSRDFKKLTIQTPPPPGMVFLVFVLSDGTIDDWTWRESEEDGTPKGVTGELLWPCQKQT